MTDARVPFGVVNRLFGFERNMFDRVGHFSVGCCAYGIADLLMDTLGACAALAVHALIPVSTPR